MPSGSPATFVLRLPRPHAPAKAIDATLALTRRGMTMLRAKRAIEELLAGGRAFVDLPAVESPEALAADLRMAGVAAAPAGPPPRVDVGALRRRLGLTRGQFAARYGLEVETVRNWEAGRREPDTTARSYLHAIANDPERVEQAYAPTPSV